MPKIIFEGWDPGMRKIPFTMLLHEKAGLSLRDAKDIKDRLVNEGKIIEIIIEDQKLASEILEEAINLKVKARMV